MTQAQVGTVGFAGILAATIGMDDEAMQGNTAMTVGLAQ